MRPNIEDVQVEGPEAFYRMLSILGYETIVVMNITDVDDKIIQRANEHDISPLKLAQNFEV